MKNSTEFRPSGIITLTTDFGLRDPYVGAMKGVILRQNPQAQIVDLCHFISPQAIHEAAFYLRGSWEYFPPGTIHVAVVDPGVGSKRSILVAKIASHLFLAPDNGLLTELLRGGASVWKLEESLFALPSTGRTFHGRDIFAPAAGKLSMGLALDSAGTLVSDWHRAPLPKPATEKGMVEGEVLLVDRFGNLVTNVTESDLEAAFRNSRDELCVFLDKTRIEGISGTYRDGAPGKPLALLGSYGHLEVAIPMGNASEALRAGTGTAVRIRPKEIS